MKSLIVLLAGAALLAGCNDRASIENGDGSVAIDANSDSGRLSVKLPGMKADLALPKSMLGNSRFDIDGVGLYPGAKVTAMKVDALGENKASGVRIDYTAPAAVDQVRTWYTKAFADKHVAIAPAGPALTGKTADGDAVSMTFAPDGGTGTRGRIEIIDAK